MILSTSIAKMTMEEDRNNSSTMNEQPQQRQDPTSSEPLLKQAVNAAFSKEYRNWPAMGPMGIGWGLSNSWACVFYWNLQFFALLFLAAAIMADVETDLDAREKNLTITRIAAAEILFLAGRILCWKKKRHDQASLTHCTARTLLEIAIFSCIFLGMVLIKRLEVSLIGKTIDGVTTKSWIFYYAVVVVSYLGILLSVSHAWEGAHELQNMSCISVVNAVCTVQLAATTIQVCVDVSDVGIKCASFLHGHQS